MEQIHVKYLYLKEHFLVKYPASTGICMFKHGPRPNGTIYCSKSNMWSCRSFISVKMLMDTTILDWIKSKFQLQMWVAQSATFLSRLWADCIVCDYISVSLSYATHKTCIDSILVQISPINRNSSSLDVRDLFTTGCTTGPSENNVCY